jgi:hypothetical protein
MSERIDKIVAYFILILCAAVIMRSVFFIQNQNKWSPIDEYAHMDYVDKLSEGHFPKLSDQISEEMYQHILTDSARNLHHNVQSRIQLGIASLSYEAIHPPLYHLILSLPDKLMIKMQMNIFSRLKVLRIFSYILFVIGMFMCVPVFKSIAKLGYSIPLSYGLGCVLFGLIIGTHQRYGLGNNMLSPLMINSTAYFLINYYIKTSDKTLYLFLLMCCLSVFSAFSNFFIIPFLYLLLLKKYRHNITFKNFMIGVSIILGFAILLLLWKVATKPDKSINDYVQMVFAYYIPKGFVNYKIYFQLLSFDAFTLSFIQKGFDINLFMLTIFILSNSVCLIFVKTVLKKQIWILFYGFLFGVFMVTTFLLNKYVAGIHWMAFRHYLGFIPVWYVSCTAFLLVLNSKYSKQNKLLDTSETVIN